MTDTPSNTTDPQQAAPSPLTVHGQYIKDLSFENPRAPQSLIEQTQPQLTLNVQVTNRQFDAKTFEVALAIEEHYLPLHILNEPKEQVQLFLVLEIIRML